MEIVRDDFPGARKGWDPEAVLAHLRVIADEVAELERPLPMADAAAAGVRSVLAAAERDAAEFTANARSEVESAISDARAEAEPILSGARAEADETRAAARTEAEGTLAEAESELAEARTEANSILSEAQEESERILATARTESEEVVSSAQAEASRRIEEVESAVGGVISRATELGNRVGAFGRELTQSFGSLPPAQQGQAAQDPGAAALDTASSEAEGPPPVSTSGAAEQAGPAAPDGGAAEEARMTAARMALEGHSRETIAARLESEFGPIAGIDELLDGILERFGP